MRKKTISIALLILSLFLLVGCGSKDDPDALILGEIDYEIITVIPEELQEWYEEKSRDGKANVSSLEAYQLESDRYLLISAGEKPTGGYTIDNITINGTKKEIEVSAELIEPAAGSIVTEAITYPHVLVKIVNDQRSVKFLGIKSVQGEGAGNDNNSSEYQQVTGVYVGQIDSNSIEIKINDQVENDGFKAFRLSEESKEGLDQIEDGSKVSVKYYLNEHEQPVIVSIEKI